jgi:hypothetical protein
VATRQAEIAAAGGADRRSAKNAAAPLNQSREAHLAARPLHEARAWSRLGNRREAEDALRRGGTALARLPVAGHPEHHFVFDPSKL